MKQISLYKLSKLLSYNRDTGLFTWLLDRNNSVKEGDIAGCVNNRGYIVIVVNKKMYQAHRLAWLYMYGEYPTHGIDHINGNKTDNRIENIRDVPQSENTKNQCKAKNNTSGVVGVYWHKRDKRWATSISVSGKYINGGSYVDFSEAVNARKNLEVLYGFHENHGKDI